MSDLMVSQIIIQQDQEYYFPRLYNFAKKNRNNLHNI